MPKGRTHPTPQDIERAKKTLETLRHMGGHWMRRVEVIAQALADARFEGGQYYREMWHCIKHDECGQAEEPNKAYCHKCVAEQRERDAVIADEWRTACFKVPNSPAYTDDEVSEIANSVSVNIAAAIRKGGV